MKIIRDVLVVALILFLLLHSLFLLLNSLLGSIYFWIKVTSL